MGLIDRTRRLVRQGEHEATSDAILDRDWTRRELRSPTVLQKGTSAVPLAKRLLNGNF